MASKMITLKACDGALFEIESKIAKEMKIVQFFIEDFENNEPIPLHNVFGHDLAKIIEYCKKSGGEEESKEAKVEYDAEFVKGLNSDDKLRLLQAASYLNMKNLLEVLLQAVANEIENKSVEYVRNYLHIENDYTPEEEAELRKQNEWAFKEDKN